MVILIYVQVDELWLYTASVTDGIVTDACKGDSGGPLIIEKGGQHLLIGVLEVIENHKKTKVKIFEFFQGEGYNCRTNTSSGDGSWSNVVSQRDWILGHISGSISGSTFQPLRVSFPHFFRTDQPSGKSPAWRPWWERDEGKCLH